MRLFIFLTICLFTELSFSASADGKFRIGTGVLSFEAFKNTTNENASTDTLGTNYILPIQAQARFPVKKYAVAPRLLYTLIPKEAEDNGYSSTILLTSVPVLFPVGKLIEVSFGPGYMLRSIKGNGGSIELGNGGSTSVFGLPARTETSKNFLLEAGIHFNIAQYVVSFETLGMSLLSERRAVSFLLALSYKL